LLIHISKLSLISLLLIIFLFILPSVYSIYEELVYSETVEDKDVVEIEGSTFKFRIDSVSNKALIEIDDSGLILGNGECKIKDNFDICISNINFSYRNYTSYIDTYKALVKVYQIKSKLDITSSIDKSNILIDGEATATLTLENTADIAAEDVTAIINIPSNLLITDVEGCKKEFNSIVFQDNVHRGTRTCTYKLQGLIPGDFDLDASIMYFDGITQINTSSSTSGTVNNYSLRITPILNKSKFNIKEKFDLKINVENINEESNLIVTILNIKLPEKIIILNLPPELNINNNVASWSGTLAPEEKKEFVLGLQILRTKNYLIIIEASYKIDKFLRKAEASTNIDVSCDCPYITHDFSRQITAPDQRIGLSAFITNPSDVNTFLKLNINYITNIPNIQDYSTGYADIKPLQTIKIFDSSIITPPLDEIYYFNITSTFDSSAQPFVVKENIVIKIPQEEVVERPPEDETEIKEQQDPEEQQEVEEVSIGTGEIEQLEESSIEESEEIPITTLSEEEPFNAFTLLLYIGVVIFLLITLIIFKRRGKKRATKESETKEPKVEKAQPQRHKLKELFSMIHLKRQKSGDKIEFSDQAEDAEYQALKRQIEKLDISPKPEQVKKGSTGRISKK